MHIFSSYTFINQRKYQNGKKKTLCFSEMLYIQLQLNESGKGNARLTLSRNSYSFKLSLN